MRAMQALGMLAGVLVLAICACGSPAKNSHERYFLQFMPRAVFDRGPMNLQASPRPVTSNAKMVVVCERNGRVIKRWEGQTHYNGTLPVEFTAEVRQGRISNELGLDPAQVRLEVHSNGSGGVTLEQWVDPSADRVIVTVAKIGKGIKKNGVLGKEGDSGKEGENAGRGDKQESVTIPARLRPLFKDNISREDPVKLRRVFAKLEQLSDAELKLYELSSELAGDLDALEASVDKVLSAKNGTAEAAQPGEGSGLEGLSDEEARDILRLPPGKRRHEIGAWVNRQAKRQAAQTLKDMWNAPGQAAVAMAKGLNPVEQSEGIMNELGGGSRWE